MPWVLKECGKRSYFQQWTGIGPRFTQKISQAERFRTEQDAKMSPAWSFPYTIVETKKIKK